MENQGLTPADPNFDKPGRIDVLLGADVIPFIQSKDRATDSVVARDTVFGHVFLGTYDSLPDSIPVVSNVQIVRTKVADSQARDELSVAVTKFWEVEEPPARTQVFSAEEVRVQKHYMSTHRFLPDAGRFEVTLPRKQEAGVLGESRTMALQRFYSNERSLLKKGHWAEFQKVVKEYLDLAHARPCTSEESAMASREVYYMPMHCVRKASSTTTKLRVVFDASAKTTSGLSYNDTLAVGPMLHMTLDRILMRFRMHRVALTGDVQKMYREILLAPSDQNFHRFVWRAQVSDPVSEFCMNRVTFGVTSSPYVAVQTLQQAAEEFGADSPEAVGHLKKSFYVDDLLGGADTVAEAVKLQQELSRILTRGGFTLRKFRSSHEDVVREIPQELVEPLPPKDLVDSYVGKHPKALGLKWNSESDKMAVDVCTHENFEVTKRGLLSDIAKTFDVLGWINPVILPAKLLMQELWDPNLGCLPEPLRIKHQLWREELSQLADLELPRCYFSNEPSKEISLHGFSDASEKAYGAVVYIRAIYENHPPTVNLVVAKNRVLPLREKRTIPELELMGAVLLADLLQTVQQTLELEVNQVRAWSDSTTVLCWLKSVPTKYKVFVANRITTATEYFSPSIWSHVPTLENPADLASRGVAAGELKRSKLWWSGPSWLSEEPIVRPRQPQEAEIEAESSVGLKASYLAISVAAPPPPVWVEGRFRSYHKVIRITAWIIRAGLNFGAIGQEKNTAAALSVSEVEEAEQFLLKRSQGRTFAAEIKALSQSPPHVISKSSNILPLHPYLGRDGLLHLGGRLSHADTLFTQKHPILLSAKDELTRRIFEQTHVSMCHCGPTLLMSTAGKRFYCTGARLLAKQICHQCLHCRKIQAKAQTQLMGQLPKDRVTPSRPFSTTGVDYCGPFTYREGRGRGLRKMEGYIAVFVCFVTKAVHLEPASDLTTGTFLAALKRFVSRRNIPRNFHSDNGSNFIGAKNELEKLYSLLGTNDLPPELQTYLVDHRLIWHLIPARAPHFGGLWEAAVKSAKFHLKRIIGKQLLSFEEMLTTTCQVEACLNSRPLGIQHCQNPEGIEPLTPGHFLTGGKLTMYPETETTPQMSLMRRWTLCQQIVQEFWTRWSAEYLQQLQAAQKWNHASPNLEAGDVVLMKDASKFNMNWGLAQVTEAFPGEDGKVRAVEILTKKVAVPGPEIRRPLNISNFKVKSAILRRPVTKLALLIPAKKVMTTSEGGTPHGGEDVGAIAGELQDKDQEHAAASL